MIGFLGYGNKALPELQFHGNLSKYESKTFLDKI